MGCIPCEAKAEARARSGGTQKSFARPRLMPDGSFVYPKKGFEPPPPMAGYTRDPGNHWRFIPQWLPCKDRISTLQMKKCGAYDMLMVCNSQDCPLKQIRVTAEQCKACSHRKES